jgi:hypothetical protein
VSWSADGGGQADISRGSASGLSPHSHLTDSLFLLWEDVIVILIVGSFNHAFTVVTCLRFCLLSLRTRLLILLTNGIIEALRQLFLSCLETVYARALFIGWSTKQHYCEQREHEGDVHNNTSREKFQGDVHHTPMNIDQWFLEISLTVTPAGVFLLCQRVRLSTVCS